MQSRLTDDEMSRLSAITRKNRVGTPDSCSEEMVEERQPVRRVVPAYKSQREFSGMAGQGMVMYAPYGMDPRFVYPPGNSMQQVDTSSPMQPAPEKGSGSAKIVNVDDQHEKVKETLTGFLQVLDYRKHEVEQLKEEMKKVKQENKQLKDTIESNDQDKNEISELQARIEELSKRMRSLVAENSKLKKAAARARSLVEERFSTPDGRAKACKVLDDAGFPQPGEEPAPAEEL